VQVIEGKFLFSLVWALGGSATTDSRKVIDAFLKKLLSGDMKIPDFEKRKLQMPERGSLFDYNFVGKKGGVPGTAYEWVSWVDFINLAEKIPAKTQPQEIIVSTNDTERYSFLLGLNISNEIPTLFCGPTGTGKSCYIKNYLLTKLPVDKYMSIELGFSAQTSSIQTQDIIDSKLDRKRKGVFGPKMGKCILFVDDLNMPAKEKYGAQPPIELLRQFIDQGGWYEHKDKDKPFRNLVDIILVAAMGPPGGGRTFISPRLLRHLTLVSLTSFED
jgi:dynein heavy chain